MHVYSLCFSICAKLRNKETATLNQNGDFRFLKFERKARFYVRRIRTNVIEKDYVYSVKYVCVFNLHISFETVNLRPLVKTYSYSFKKKFFLTWTALLYRSFY